MELDKRFVSAAELLEHMIIDLGDPEMDFNKFMKVSNDYYNQRSTSEGIARIYRLFDNEGLGKMTKQDIERISGELDMFFRPDQLD